MFLWNKISKQFGKPIGCFGYLAGFIMAHRKSNIERNRWSVELLKLQSDDHVLEIGYGPGLAIQTLSEIVTDGVVYGLDHSELMLKQAVKRNRKEIENGRVKLVLGSVSGLPAFNTAFDKVLDINSFQFWDRPVEALIKIHKHMKPGGIIVIVHQPRKPGAMESDTLEAGNKFSGFLQQAGFKNIRMEVKDMKPVPVVGVTGMKEDRNENRNS